MVAITVLVQVLRYLRVGLVVVVIGAKVGIGRVGLVVDLLNVHLAVLECG